MNGIFADLPLPNLSGFWRRIRNTTRTIFTRGDFSTLIITCLLIVIPVLALNTSLAVGRDLMQPRDTWQVSMNQLIPVAILSVMFGFLLSRSHYSEAFALMLSGVYSVAVIFAVQYVAAPGNVLTKVLAVMNRLVQSLSDSTTTGSLDPFILVLFFSVLIWFLGHNTAWHTFRLDHVWRAVLPPGIVLALNGFYSVEPYLNIDLYVIAYVYLSLMLVVRSHIEAREFDWYMNRVAFGRSLRDWFFRSGALVGVVLLVLAWVMPTGSTEENAKRFQQFLSGDMMGRISQLLNKLFSSLEGSGVASVDYYGSDRLRLGGALKLGDQIVMVVKAPSGPRYFWKSRVFDIYQDSTWTAPRAFLLTADAPGLDLRYPPGDPSSRRVVEQQITMAVATSGLLYAAPQPIHFDVPAQVELDYVDESTKTMNPGVTRQVQRLQEGESYAVTSSISIATAAYLRGLPPGAPEWVARLDLQLPNGITPRTRQLAQQIIQQAKATTNFDKARAIELWLRANIRYNESIAEPPTNRELVDWVLFEKREGYCTYYASAMVVMLRSLGIPARMAAGFSQGLYDPATQSYIIRERDAHTWVEVYFPQAGWIEFEPTSSQEPLERPDGGRGQPTQTPASGSAPLPPATPTATATLTPTPTPQDSGAPQQPLPVQVTPTATPSPTLDPTAAAGPTQAPPPQPISNSPQISPVLQWLLNVLVALAVAIAIASFAAVGLLWWVEYRGVDRLGPIGRAYERLAKYARWLGVSIDEANTPLERGRQIAKDVPEGNRAINTITDMYIYDRYAKPHPVASAEEARAQSAWKRARRSLIILKLRRWLRRK